MTVYVTGQISIHNREEYDLYSSKFMGVFEKFNGTLLSADFEPRVLEGEWDKDRVILMSFPDKKSFIKWATSPEYQEIMKHRVAGSTGVFLLSKGVEAE